MCEIILIEPSVLIRQLVTFIIFLQGFRKIDTDNWEFANDGFVRGQKHLLKNISRRKNVQAVDQQKQSQKQDKSVEPWEKIESTGLWKQVEDLKTDKNALGQELIKLRQHQETADSKLLRLKDRLQGMEKNQQQLLSFLVMAMQSPSFLVKLLHPKENNWRMAEAGTILEQETEEDELFPSDGMIVPYQPPVDGTPNPAVTAITGSQNLSESDSFFDGLKDFCMNSDFMKNFMEENHAPFILPDLYDDFSWEQLLLTSSLKESIEDPKHDDEGSNDCRVETDSTDSGNHLDKVHDFELLMQQIEKSHDSEKSPTMELLTEKMDHLGSGETNRKRRLP